MITARAKQDVAMELISEFVFQERIRDTDLRHKLGNRHSNSPQMLFSQLNLIQEFQLVLALIEYFSRPGSDATRNAVFLSLFGSNLNPGRSSILSKLISTSISGSVAPCLASAGCWMQQLGCTSSASTEIARNLVKDFVTYSKKTSEQLKMLPMVAPRFASNFMTAVADLYMNESFGSGGMVPPPDMLLEVFTEWITDNPSLCLASQQPLALPSGAIAMPVVTPIAGLIRWTVLSGIHQQTSKIYNHYAYSKLHLGLLETILQIPPPNGPATAINSQHLIQIIHPLNAYARRLNMENIIPETNEAFQLSLEKFAQAIQVALHARCVYGSIPQLLGLLESLPASILMEIVIKANKN